MKECPYCGNIFKVSKFRKRYCSILCAKNSHDLQKSQYKKRNKYEIRLKEIKRTKFIKIVLKKNATNKNNKYTDKDDDLIMSKIDNKYEYSANILAYRLKRTKQSIEQRRTTLKRKISGEKQRWQKKNIQS